MSNPRQANRGASRITNGTFEIIFCGAVSRFCCGLTRDHVTSCVNVSRPRNAPQIVCASSLAVESLTVNT